MSTQQLDPNAIRVLVTGFGPSPRFNENPSWLAVEPLHNTVLYALESPTDPSLDQPIITDDMEASAPRSQQIHITAIQIPSTYQAILSIVPGLHARPPILPIQANSTDLPPPPQDGYDFMFHIGVAGRGPLRMEKLSHRQGYRMKDAEDQYAPVIPPKDAPRDLPEPNPMEEMHRLMLESIAAEHTSTVSALAELAADSPDHIQRGFGKPMYDNFPDELNTEIDVAKLIHHLKESGIEHVYSSMDAGHYLPDFCMYCSLAEAKRASSRQEKMKERSTPPKSTPVLVMHCPPVGQPLLSEEVTDAIRRIILWVCAKLQS